MTTAIIITLCILLLIAYVFDITSSKTKIPSVILLLMLGFAVRKMADLLDLSLPDLTPVLPVLGTVGLILIVLEGSLELEFNASKKRLIKRSFVVALLPMLLLALGLAWVLQQLGGSSFKDSITNALPLCVISSSIAIPSVKSLGQHNKEFVIYESSLSDILGVLFFNFVALNEVFNLYSVGGFFMQLLVIAAVSFVATIGLSMLLSRIDHHIKFAPIILLVILIYAVSKIYHLPGLVFILLFGLFLGNLDELKHIKWINKLNPEALQQEVFKFREITTEAAFLIRALFFLLFGYLIETTELLNTDTLVWSVGIVAAIFLLRALQLRLSGLALKPLMFIAPRGLITILLFLSIAPSSRIPLVNKSLIIQVVILSALVMMMGLMTTESGAKQKA
jgi:Kef-type K+ transport system membrane component KefB